VILTLALTRRDPNVVVTTRILSKSNPGAVLYERSVVDTPGLDPALTSEEFLRLSGINLSLHADLAGAPFTAAGVTVGLFQYNDGTLPAAIATYDNLELRKYEIPPLGITSAVRLSWPAVESYSVLGAPTVNGPWLPVNDTARPGMRQMTVPLDSPAQFFRLIQAP
jgi:hypothetical protein